MKKIVEVLKKCWITLLIVLVALVISFILYILLKDSKKDLKQMEFSNEFYKIKYDETWKLENSTTTKAVLTNKNDGILTIEINTLDNDYLYMTLENIVDEVSYSLTLDNPDYYLIGKQEITVTKKEYEGYQLLYENGDSEALLTFFKKGDKVVTLTYEAPYEYFDILIDSAKDIIHNFELIDTKYASSYDVVELDLKELTLNNNDLLVDETRTYTIADSHYLVEYTVPSKFVDFMFDSRSNTLTYESDDVDIKLTANVKDLNIYELLEDFKNYEYDYSVEKSKENDLIIEESYTKRNDNEYLYHVTYEYEALGEKNTYDVIYIIYELDYRKVFLMKLEAYNCYLSDSIIDNINIENVTKYAQYVKRDIRDGNLVNELKHAYTDSNYVKKYSLITLYTPEEYKEIDNGYSNMYQQRTFNKDYDEELSMYLTEVRYTISNYDTITKKLDNLESVYSYDSSTKKGLGVKTYNNKKFNMYSYKHTEDGVNFNVYVLYFTLDSGNLLEIVIESNSKIDRSQLDELTNFSEEIHDMK